MLVLWEDSRFIQQAAQTLKVIIHGALPLITLQHLLLILVLWMVNRFANPGAGKI